MRIGVGIGGRSVERMVAQTRAAADEGFPHAWANQIFEGDTLSMLAVAGTAVPGITLGTCVVPMQPRHPHALALQAATVHDACGGRLELGIGLSHRLVVEDMWGLSYDRPVRFAREYLAVLMPLLERGQVSFSGEVFRVNAVVQRAREDRPVVLLAALGPQMLRVAGELCDGTATWMTGPRTLAEHVVPGLMSAAAAAGRPAPRVVAALPVCLTTDVEGARERAAQEYAVYGSLPSYRAMLDREGAAGPADIAVVGDEPAIETGLRNAADAGVTDLVATPFGSKDEIARTRALLRSISL